MGFKELGEWGQNNQRSGIMIGKPLSPYDNGPNLTYCHHLGGVTVLYTNGSPGAWGV